MRNRPLVLTTESARHPFRQSLPRHVLMPLPQDEAEMRRAKAALSFCAFFTAFYSFIL
jgi:hypothetical protein